MKIPISIICLLLSFSAHSYQCQDFEKDKNKIFALSYIATQIYHYNDYAEFCSKDDHLDLELYFIPNYFRQNEENDDHYKLMVHYAYKSCTYIYNITKNSLSEKGCYSTW